MAYKITDECIKCGECESQCPVSAISDGDTKFVIDQEVCISCGSCESACNSKAIVEE